MSRKTENNSFICEHCGQMVAALTNGSYRNHCPFCLFSKHVDQTPGDRACLCRGLMEPAGLRYKPGKGYQIVHRCLKCGVEQVNRVAENTVQPDWIDVLINLSVRPRSRK
jgi:DNA-directed RNA polymerase subunit RPC12/RpoP